jgi:hypothetical protein
MGVNTILNHKYNSLPHQKTKQRTGVILVQKFEGHTQHNAKRKCVYYRRLLVGWISANFAIIVQYSEESTILTVCVDFDTSMNIRYGGICELNADS